MLSQPHPPVFLAPVGKDQVPAFLNLYQLYVYDFSEYLGLELNAEGRFDTPPLEAWWGTEGHFPFFIRYEGTLCGFALVRKGSPVTPAAQAMDMSEFFVVRSARRRKVGAAAARALFQKFPGPWEVRVRTFNAPALAFWTHAIEAAVGTPVATEPFSAGPKTWDVFRFTS